MASDFFLKLEGFAGEAVEHKIHQDFIKLGNAFDHLGDAFIKLVDDASSNNATGGLAVAQEVHIKHDIVSISDDFLKIGDDFIKLDTDLQKFDDAFVNSTDQFIIKIGGIEGDSAGDQGSINLGDDFHNVETDLNGAGRDFIKIGDLSDSPVLDEAFNKLGGDSIKVGDDFIKVSDDFLKIAQDFGQPSGTPETIKLDQGLLSHADDFIKLDSDLHKLDADLHKLGGDYLKIAEALEKAEHESHHESSGNTALDQLLQAAHDFSLL